MGSGSVLKGLEVGIEVGRLAGLVGSLHTSNWKGEREGEGGGTSKF